MDILRVPSLYGTQVEYLNAEDSEYVLKTLFRLSMWKDVKIEHSMRGWLVVSMYREAIQMENKARAKKWKERLNDDLATLMRDTVETVKSEKVRPSNITSSQVTSSKIKESNIVVSSEIVAPKVATLETHIKDSFSNEFISEVYEKYWLRKEDFQEECNDFLLYWKEKSVNGKKERWEKEKTFDPKLRFRTWMKNNKKWSNRVVVNSEDEERKRKLEDIKRRKELLFNKL